MCFLLDANAAIGNGKQTGKSSDMSLRKVDPIDGPREKIHGLRDEAGGGGTKEGLSKDSSSTDRTIDLIHFLTNTCGKHGMNHMIQSP